MDSILKQFETIEMNIYSANINISIGIDERPDLKMVTLFADFTAYPRIFSKKIIVFRKNSNFCSNQTQAKDFDEIECIDNNAVKTINCNKYYF
jgi:hypothetical protein